MPLNQIDSIDIVAGDGNKLITGNTITSSQTIIVEFMGNTPPTWNTLGYVYKEVLVNDAWAIVESRQLIPNRPNQYTWNDNSSYRLTFNLVKWIKPGQLLVYSYTENDPLDLSAVAYSGDYNDLINIPSSFSGNYNDLSNKPQLPVGFTYNQEPEPINPLNGETWIERELGLIKGKWEYIASESRWAELEPRQTHIARNNFNGNVASINDLFSPSTFIGDSVDDCAYIRLKGYFKCQPADSSNFRVLTIRADTIANNGISGGTITTLQTYTLNSWDTLQVDTGYISYVTTSPFQSFRGSISIGNSSTGSPGNYAFNLAIFSRRFRGSL